MSVSQKLLIAASAAATFAVAPRSNAQSVQLARAGVSVPADVGPTVADAKRLAEEGKLRSAESAYRAVIERQRNAKEYPVEALRGLSFVQFARNDDWGAANTLEELATSAAEFGDPETQLKSLFQSALLFQQLGDKHRASSHIPKIKSLLKSPVVSPELRQEVAKHLG